MRNARNDAEKTGKGGRGGVMEGSRMSQEINTKSRADEQRKRFIPYNERDEVRGAPSKVTTHGVGATAATSK